MRIVKAKPADARDVSELAAMLYSSSAKELEPEFAKTLAAGKGAVFLAFQLGQPIAFAECQLRYDYVEGTFGSPVGYLEGIFVREEHRGQGIARALVQCCEQWAAQMGCTEFASDCELTNAQSLAFHQKVGFRETNRIICFVKSIER